MWNYFLEIKIPVAKALVNLEEMTLFPDKDEV